MKNKNPTMIQFLISQISTKIAWIIGISLISGVIYTGLKIKNKKIPEKRYEKQVKKHGDMLIECLKNSKSEEEDKECLQNTRPNP